MVIDRKGKKNRGFFRILSLIAVLIGCLIVVSIFICSRNQHIGRLGVVLKGDPTIIVSWESDRPRFSVLLVPISMQIEAVKGYGWYGIDALWKLDQMDNRKGMLFRTSLEESFATPIMWHGVYQTTSQLGVQDDVIREVKRALSLQTISRMIITGQTNITIGTMWYVWRKLQTLGPDTMTLFDFRNVQITGETTLPDLTTVSRFDPERYDATIGNALEDTPIRQEGIRIAIYNTTETPGIAQRIARVVEHVGGFVVAVGNDDTPYAGMCELSGTKSAVLSRTGQFFRETYGCTVRESEEGDRAELVIRLGKEIEKRYLPD